MNIPQRKEFIYLHHKPNHKLQKNKMFDSPNDAHNENTRNQTVSGIQKVHIKSF